MKTQTYFSGSFLFLKVFYIENPRTQVREFSSYLFSMRFKKMQSGKIVTLVKVISKIWECNHSEIVVAPDDDGNIIISVKAPWIKAKIGRSKKLLAQNYVGRKIDNWERSEKIYFRVRARKSPARNSRGSKSHTRLSSG